MSFVKSFSDIKKVVTFAKSESLPLPEYQVPSFIKRESYSPAWKVAIVPTELVDVDWFKYISSVADVVVHIDTNNRVEIIKDEKNILDDDDIYYATCSAAQSFATRTREYLWGKSFRNTKGILEKSGIDTNFAVEAGVYNFNPFFPVPPVVA